MRSSACVRTARAAPSTTTAAATSLIRSPLVQLPIFELQTWTASCGMRFAVPSPILPCLSRRWPTEPLSQKMPALWQARSSRYRSSFTRLKRSANDSWTPIRPEPSSFRNSSRDWLRSAFARSKRNSSSPGLRSRSGKPRLARTSWTVSGSWRPGFGNGSIRCRSANGRRSSVT